MCAIIPAFASCDVAYCEPKIIFGDLEARITIHQQCRSRTGHCQWLYNAINAVVGNSHHYLPR